jgi:hypothetical protein
MIQSYVLSGEPAWLPVVEVIELLATQDEARDADDVDESPVFQHSTVGHDMEEGWHDRHTFDVRILTAEREWSSLIDQAVTRKQLIICNCSGRPASVLRIKRGFLNMAAVAQWLADGSANVELDGIRVSKTKPEVGTKPVERVRKAAMVKKLERHWPTIEKDLKEVARPENWLRPAQMDWGALQHGPCH